MSHGAYVNYNYAKSKKALKEAMRDNPSTVFFEDTSMHSPQSFKGNELPVGASLSVVGPNPYQDRRWYATVKCTPKGVTVS